MDKPKYKKVGFNKYQCAKEYYIQTEIFGHTASIFSKDGVLLALLIKTGGLTICPGYQFDVSGPVWHTENVVCSAMVHDALCQMIDERKLPKSCRGLVDKLFHKTCLAWCLDGCKGFICRNTCRVRANYVYQAIRLYVKAFGRDK